MSIVDDVERYESWLKQRCTVVKDGLRKKHKRMAGDKFKFFRATCFRFALKIDKWAPALDDAPVVPSVGDAHIENWGTWRDGEGRLVWGVNDFDDADELPFTYDLLRLATSALLALGVPGAASGQVAAILKGYREGLSAPRPTLVDGATPWLEALADRPATTASAFRAELEDAERVEPPPKIADALLGSLPKGTHEIQLRAWQRGGGSLGRPRFVAFGQWRGGLAVREAKALVPSAWAFARGDDRAPILFERLAGGEYRSTDPFLRVESDYVLRRIAADSRKIELEKRDAQEFTADLLAGMGVDLASIHLAGAPDATRILDDLERRPSDWLTDAAQTVAEATTRDFEKWREHYRAEGATPPVRT